MTFYTPQEIAAAIVVGLILISFVISCAAIPQLLLAIVLFVVVGGSITMVINWLLRRAERIRTSRSTLPW